MMIDAEFRNARYGLAIGRFNTLANLVVGGSFVDNEITMDHDASGIDQAGTWAVFGGNASGTRGYDIELSGTASGVWYFEDFSSDAPKIFTRGFSSNGYPLFFDRSELGIGANAPLLYQYTSAMGPIFLRSQVSPAIDLHLENNDHASFGFNLYSSTPGWASASLGAAARLFTLSE